jgi:hypothetical protein
MLRADVQTQQKTRAVRRRLGRMVMSGGKAKEGIVQTIAGGQSDDDDQR